jgi:membrane-associated protein
MDIIGSIRDLIDWLTNAEGLINAVGYPGMFLIIFAETGLLLGFFLPGDTLLITAGLLCQRGTLSVGGENGLWLLIPLLIVAAVVGDFTGYQIGRHMGPRLFTRDDSRLFKKKHLERAAEFYERHGGKTIILCRFLSFVRTFAPTIAGAARMPYHRFAVYNVIGAVGWVVSLTLAGYYVGKAIPNVDVFFTGLLVLMVTASAAPALIALVRERRRQARGRVVRDTAPQPEE